MRARGNAANDNPCACLCGRCRLCLLAGLLSQTRQMQQKCRCRLRRLVFVGQIRTRTCFVSVACQRPPGRRQCVSLRVTPPVDVVRAPSLGWSVFFFSGPPGGPRVGLWWRLRRTRTSCWKYEPSCWRKDGGHVGGRDRPGCWRRISPLETQLLLVLASFVRVGGCMWVMCGMETNSIQFASGSRL